MQGFFAIYGVIMAIAVIALVCIWIFTKRRKRANSVSKNLTISEKRNTKNHLYLLYRIYLVTPVVKRYFLKLKSRYRTLFPADEVTLNKKTTERMTFCLLICLGIFCLTCIMCKGDLFFVLTGLLACYIIFTTLINSSEEKLQIKLLDQLDTFITDVHAYFHDTEMVYEAISSCLDDLPYEIGLHANKIYSIVTAVDVEAEIENYVETAPNKFLLLMAAICASVKEYGDEKLANGKSVFRNNLDYLKSELNMERIRMRDRVIAFSGKVISVLAPLFCLKPLEIFMKHFFPDTATFYDGNGGVIAMAIILTITLVAYELINSLKDSDNQNRYGEQRALKAVSNLPFMKDLLSKYTEHNYSKTLRLADALKATGDTNGTDVFILKRISTAILLAIMVNVIGLAGIARAKEVVADNYEECYKDALIPNENYRQTMRDLSLEYNGYVKDTRQTEEELKEHLRGAGLTEDRMIQIIVDEMDSKRDEYKTHYYKWYILFISVGAAVLGYMIPYWLLHYRKKIMQMNREDEVAQFRTLILILMHEDGMTLDTVLEWMERFAHTFKSSIADCIINLEYSKRGAIEKMREEEGSFAPFRRLCDSLISEDDVGLEGAFDDLEIEREYYQEKRKTDNKVLLSKCTKKANKIMMLPVWAIIIFYLIVPFGTYAANMLVDFSSIL